jgi:PAS domain S-box-containing protein
MSMPVRSVLSATMGAKMSKGRLHQSNGNEAPGKNPPERVGEEKRTSEEAEAFLRQWTGFPFPKPKPTNPTFDSPKESADPPPESKSGSGSSNQPEVEKAYRKVEARYRTLVEQIPAVTFHASLEGGINELYVSPQIETLLGFTQKEWLEDPVLWYRQLHPDDRERWHTEFARTIATGERFQSEYRFLARDGRVVWVHGEAHLVRDESGLPLFLQGVAYDVTERKRVEETLRHAHVELEARVRERTAELAAANETLRAEIEERRRAEAIALEWKERFEATVRASGQVLYDWNSATNEVTYAGNLQAILGYSPEEMAGGLTRWIELIHPEDRETFLKEIESVKPAKKPFHQEYRVRKKDGSIILVEDEGYYVRDRSGKVDHVVGFVTDVTRQRALEEQLRQSQKVEAVGRLAGGVAHDFNNLLTVITGYCDLLLADLDPSDSRRPQAQEILKAAKRATDLTAQLLAFGRKAMIAPRILDLNALILDAQKMLSRLIGEDIDLTTILEHALGRVRADSGQLHQVIVNLAVNARDAMPRGGKLTLRTANVELDETYARLHPEVRPGPYVLLAISDTGQGMTEEVRTHLFEPFFTTKELGKGTGLGLATVHGIVMQHGGHIEVESALGRGSTFQIYLPRAEPAPRVEELEAPEKVLARGSETILLAEDEDGVRKLAQIVLQQAGYEVLAAEDGPRAEQLSFQYEKPIHLLVTDLVMPQMSGRELAESVARQRPTIKVLYLSGYTEDVIVRHGIANAEVAFLQKPFTPAGLTRKVRELLDG